MALNGIPISDDQCIGDSLVTINNAFSALDVRTSNTSVGAIDNKSVKTASLHFAEMTIGSSTPVVPALDGGVIYQDTNSPLGINLDAVVIEKTDGNHVVPDGGIIFTNRGSNGVRNIAMTIRGTGNVGIGTTNPTTTLHVSGDSIINGLTIGRGSGNFASNTVLGENALDVNTTGGLYNTAIGYLALSANQTGESNVAVGCNSLRLNTTGDANIAVGPNAMTSNTIGSWNTAVGWAALSGNRSGSYNTACGNWALMSNTTGLNNVSVGNLANAYNETGDGNVSIGSLSLFDNKTGSYNVAVGYDALSNNVGGSNNVAIGNAAGNTISGTLTANAICIGYNAQVTGSNQIQLGSGSTTCFTNGAVQNRSDERDKADIRDTELGLEFINALRPVDFKWDMREDYRPEAPKIVFKPRKLKEDASDEEKAKYAEELAAYEEYVVLKNKWLQDVRLANITHDGSKKRYRYHHGLIAQELKTVLDSKGIDFGGFQDHKVNGGDDVLSIGYTELIAPIIKSIQELTSQNEALQIRLQVLENK